MGGTVDEFSVHPFSGSSITSSNTPAKGDLLIAAGGFLFGFLLAITPALLALRIKSVWTVPFLLLGAFGGLSNGSYLILGTLVRKGDPGILIHEGVPLSILLFGGLCLIICGAIIGVFSFPRIGLRSQHSLIQRLIFFSSGLLPYIACFLLYRSFQTGQIESWQYILCWLMISIALILIASWLSKYLQQYMNRFEITTSIEVKWKPAIVYLLTALGIICVEMYLY